MAKRTKLAMVTGMRPRDFFFLFMYSMYELRAERAQISEKPSLMEKNCMERPRVMRDRLLLREQFVDGRKGLDTIVNKEEIARFGCFRNNRLMALWLLVRQ